MEILKLPVGIENFEDIRRSGFYYIDKIIYKVYIVTIQQETLIIV